MPHSASLLGVSVGRHHWYQLSSSSSSSCVLGTCTSYCRGLQADRLLLYI